MPMTKWTAGSTRLAGVTGICWRDGSRRVAEQIDSQSSHLWIARHALWPPNASEFEMALFAATARPVLGI